MKRKEVLEGTRKLKLRRVVKVEPAFDVNLPAELWIYILDFLRADEKLRLRLVCTLWRELISQYTYSAVIHKRGNLTKVLTLFPNLQHVQLINKDFHSKQLKGFSKLRSIRLDNVRLEDVHISELPQLEELTWCTTEKIHKNCLISVFRLLAERPAFKRLTLYNKHAYCDTCIPYYGEMKSLEELHIINGSGFTFGWLEKVATLPNLQMLDIRGTSLDRLPANWYTKLRFNKLKVLRSNRVDWRANDEQVNLFVRHLTSQNITVELY